MRLLLTYPVYLLIAYQANRNLNDKKNTPAIKSNYIRKNARNFWPNELWINSFIANFSAIYRSWKYAGGEAKPTWGKAWKIECKWIATNLFHAALKKLKINNHLLTCISIYDT